MKDRSSKLAAMMPTTTPAQFEAAVARAVALLRAGELVALPTETVYGLAANALDPHAVERIFQVKGRPARNPIIVHVADVCMARLCVREWTKDAEKLAAAFWPGPITLVLLKAEVIPSLVTAGGPTVGVRCPSHPFIQAVIRGCGFPLAAPSANLSSQVSPTTARHVWRTLGDQIQLVVDGGPARVGIESTVLDLSGAKPRLLRPGMISVEALRTLCGELLDTNSAQTDALTDDKAQGPLRSPGLMSKHYAPKARLAIREWNNSSELQAQIKNLGFPIDEVHVLAHTNLPSIPGLGRLGVMPREPAQYARGLYAELHRCDETGARLIIVEALPPTVDWQAITDRLRRAAAP